MNEKRLAALVAAALLVVAGLFVQTLPAGDLFGTLSFIAGSLLFVSTVFAVLGERGTTRPSPQTRRNAVTGMRKLSPAPVRAVPQVTFRLWSGTTPWGTTPLGVASRAIVPAVLSLMLLVPSRTGSVSDPVSLPGPIVTLGWLALAFLPITVLPWLFERWTRPTFLFARCIELRVLIPTVLITGLVLLLLATGQPRWWAIVLASAQVAWACGAAFTLYRAVPNGQLAVAPAELATGSHP